LALNRFIDGKALLSEGSREWCRRIVDLIPLSSIDPLSSYFLMMWKRFFGSQGSKLIVTYDTSKMASTLMKIFGVSLTVAILLIPAFILLWISMDAIAKSAIISISTIVFASLVSGFTNARDRDVLIGTAA